MFLFVIRDEVWINVRFNKVKKMKDNKNRENKYIEKCKGFLDNIFP